MFPAFNNIFPSYFFLFLSHSLSPSFLLSSPPFPRANPSPPRCYSFVSPEQPLSVVPLSLLSLSLSLSPSLLPFLPFLFSPLPSLCLSLSLSLLFLFHRIYPPLSLLPSAPPLPSLPSFPFTCFPSLVNTELSTCTHLADRTHIHTHTHSYTYPRFYIHDFFFLFFLFFSYGEGKGRQGRGKEERRGRKEGKERKK